MAYGCQEFDGRTAVSRQANGLDDENDRTRLRSRGTRHTFPIDLGLVSSIINEFVGDEGIADRANFQGLTKRACTRTTS